MDVMQLMQLLLRRVGSEVVELGKIVLGLILLPVPGIVVVRLHIVVMALLTVQSNVMVVPRRVVVSVDDRSMSIRCIHQVGLVQQMRIVIWLVGSVV